MSKMFSVLYAEDDANDAHFAKRIFRKYEIPACLTIVPNGKAAIEYLDGKGAYSDRAAHPLPTLVLLDINMPGTNGFDVLAWVRQQPAFKDLPVVMFSSSDMPKDRKRAVALGANEYLVKAVREDENTKLLTQMVARWSAPRSPRATGD